MLILASSSPRRRELLEAAGISHRVQAANIPEVRRPGEPADAFVQRMALEKAEAISLSDGDIVLGADTVVCVGDELLCKPTDVTEARHMMRAIAGKRHWVYTGICLRTSYCLISDLAGTAVDFIELSEAEIEAYTLSGEGLDKAGAYGIQGLASRYVRAIEGSYQNVVGLPISLVYSHLRRLNYL